MLDFKNKLDMTEDKKIYLIFFLAFSLLAYIGKMKFLGIIYAFSVLTIFFPENRRFLLNLSTIFAFFFINPYFLSSGHDIRLISFLFYIVFNAFWIFLAEKLRQYKIHVFTALFLIALLIFGYVSFINSFFHFENKTILIFNPIFFSFFSYSYYLRNGMNGLSFVEKILWIRPFWYIWIVPLGNMNEALDVRRKHLSFELIYPRLKTDLFNLSVFIVVFSVFENLFFQDTYYLHRLDFLPNLMKLPYTHTNGFGVMLSDRFTQVDVILAQIFSSLHYIGSAYLFTTAYLSSVTLSGAIIHPHTDKFWEAKSFSEFYFKISYHYSVLIKYTILKPLVSLLNFIRNYDLKLMVAIFMSVFFVSSVCMFFGRGLKYEGYILGVRHTQDFLNNYHYAFITGFVCAVSNFLRSKNYNKFFPQYLKPFSVLFYFFITSLTFVFAFHFLLSNFETKLLFLKKFFGIT